MNFFEDTLVLWIIIQRMLLRVINFDGVIWSGGSPSSATQAPPPPTAAPAPAPTAAPPPPSGGGKPGGQGQQDGNGNQNEINTGGTDFPLKIF